MCHNEAKQCHTDWSWEKWLTSDTEAIKVQ